MAGRADSIGTFVAAGCVVPTVVVAGLTLLSSARLQGIAVLPLDGLIVMDEPTASLAAGQKA